MLAQVGFLLGNHEKIYKIYTFQSMDLANNQLLEIVENDQNLALKFRDFHTKPDMLTGQLKTFRNSEKISKLAEEFPQIRKTVLSGDLPKKDVHGKFIEPILSDFKKSNSLVFKKKFTNT